ncbi:hexosaminidase [Parelusimicrobium proximum]|uniref:family 20 glycosylhydrolase n=1 Tax=Parelusimicrobium proximum TaxID=3228953 RepID=UPI003D17232E
MKNIISFLAAVLMITGASFSYAKDKTPPPPLLEDLSNVNIRYHFDGNMQGGQCAALGADSGSCFQIRMILNSPKDIPDTSWALYFHSIRRVIGTSDAGLSISHLTGDLYSLTPNANFTGLHAGKPLTITLISEYWQMRLSDNLPRLFFEVNGQTAVVKNTDTEELASFVTGTENMKKAGEKTASSLNVNSRYEEYKNNIDLPKKEYAHRVIPAPIGSEYAGGEAILKKGVEIKTKALSKDSLKVLKERVSLYALSPAKDAYVLDINITPAALPYSAQKSGGYVLKTDTSSASAVAFDEEGAFYAATTFLNLINPSDKSLPVITITDAPRYEYRAAMVDSGRNFHSKEAVLRLIDVMSMYKMNTLHFHLSDDEGWRIEIKGLPELTEAGAKRCFDLSEEKCLLPQLGQGPEANERNSGYYTAKDFVEILKYAKARHINVIPEIDMPGHSRAAVVSMEARYKKYAAKGKEEKALEYRLLDPEDATNMTTVQFYDRKSVVNPCLPSTLKFTEKVITEIHKMYKKAGVPLLTWHYGGDEAKNIFRGSGYTTTAEKGKGRIKPDMADEPWSKSPVCQAMIDRGEIQDFAEIPSRFAVKVSAVLKEHNIPAMQAWQDGIKHAQSAEDFYVSKTRVNFWDTLFWGGADGINEWLDNGYEVVLSLPDYTYIDMPAENDIYESGYYWGSNNTSIKKIFTFTPGNLYQNAETALDKNGNAFETKVKEPSKREIKGISAHLWSEIIRDDAKLEYMAYPRIIAVAERAWAKPSWEQHAKEDAVYKYGVSKNVDKEKIEKEWNIFANALAKRELAKLDIHMINYRMPMVGADKKTMTVNAELPVKIEYSVSDKGYEPELLNIGDRPDTSSLKGKPISAEADTLILRTVSPYGTRGAESRVTIYPDR